MDAAGLSSKSWYGKERQANGRDIEIKTKIEKILYDFPCYGYRRITQELKRRGTEINRKKTRRIMRRYGFHQKIRRKTKIFTTDSNHKLFKYPNLIKEIIPLFPNHIWTADITFIKLRNGAFCYLSVIIDVFTRNVRGWSLKNTLETELVLESLIKALRYGTPLYHHSDRGKQYCSIEYTDKLKEKGIQISMSDKGEPTQNPFAESFFKTLKVEETYMFEYGSIEEAKISIKRFIEIVYSKKRLHSSLGYIPPEEFEARFTKLKGQLLLNHNNVLKIARNSISAVS